MDTFGALALATEPPAEDILLRKPYNKNAPIVTENMQRNVYVRVKNVKVGPNWRKEEHFLFVLNSEYANKRFYG